MPRYKENPFTLFERSLPSGTTVFYYYTYDRHGKRTSPRSTGIGYTRKRDAKKKGREAEEYLWDLYDRGALGGRRDVPTLSEWVARKNFWDWHRSEYVRGKLARSAQGKEKITQGYVDKGKSVWRDKIEPYHGEKYIDEITPQDCDELLFQWVDDGHAHKTANNFRSFYSVMMKEAKRLGYIATNPWDNVEGLQPGDNRFGAFTIAEYQKLFNSPIGEKKRDRVYFYAIKLAFLTGLRISEVVGLQVKNIRDIEIQSGETTLTYSYVHVDRQWSAQYHKLIPVKDKEPRDVPITPALREEIDQFLSGEFVFSFHPRSENPITGNRLREWFYERMEELDIPRYDENGKKKVFHSTRRFFNTLLKQSNVAGDTIRRFTGHDTEAMTEHYTDYLPEDMVEHMREVSRAQERLIGDGSEK
jgi:integrase